jgi:hypothetical protein
MQAAHATANHFLQVNYRGKLPGRVHDPGFVWPILSGLQRRSEGDSEPPDTSARWLRYVFWQLLRIFCALLCCLL